MTRDDRLSTDPALVTVYDIGNAGGDDLVICTRLTAEARSVLALGCGTGAFLAGLNIAGSAAIGRGVVWSKALNSAPHKDATGIVTYETLHRFADGRGATA